MTSKKVSLASLAAQIERGFAAVAGDIIDISKEMATKKGIVKINETLVDHTKTLADHTKTLADHTRDLNIIKNDVKTKSRQATYPRSPRHEHREKSLRRFTGSCTPVAANDNPPRPATSVAN